MFQTDRQTDRQTDISVESECYHYFNLDTSSLLILQFCLKQSNLAKGDIACMQNKSKIVRISMSKK